MPSLPRVDAQDPEAMADGVADALRDHGACRLPRFPDETLSQALRNDLQRLRTDDALAPAATGRGAGRDASAGLRGDATLWLDDPRAGKAASAYLAALDALRVALNRRLFLGVEEVEAHYAAYPPGTRYVRHRDRFRDDDKRVLSFVTYLNPGWSATDGGALRIALPDGDIDVVPDIGSVCFVSELEHEVLPAMRERCSIAGWLRRRA